MTITIQPKPRVEPACMDNPDLWYSTRPFDRALAVHTCKNHCPLLDWCRQRPRAAESVQAGVLHDIHGRPATRQPAPRAIACATCRDNGTAAETSRWADCGQFKAYRRHVRRGEHPCQPCIDARRARDREQAKTRTRKPRPAANACGTVRGLTLHREAGEPPCDVCVRAQRAASEKGLAALRGDDATHQERIAKVRALAGRGLSDPQIGLRLGIPDHRVRHLRKTNGIPAGLSVGKTPARRSADMSIDDYERAVATVRRLAASHHTDKEIAAQLGVTWTKVRSLRRANHIPAGARRGGEWRNAPADRRAA